MAVVKKTYSRQNSELSTLNEREKENCDPFDELLLSPLKQDVEFKPLSFWGRSAQISKSKKKSKSVKCGLFEASDSDDNSPNNRRKKSKFKYSKCKGRALPVDSKNDKNKNTFSNSSFIKKNNFNRAVKSAISVATEKAEKLKNHSSDNAVCFGKSPTINSTFNGPDSFKFVSVRKQSKEGSCTSHLSEGFNIFSPKLCKNNAEITSGCLRETEKNSSPNIIKFKIYEDASEAKESLEVGNDSQTVVCTESKEWGNLTSQPNDSMERTLLHSDKSLDNCKFITVKRYYNNFDKERENCNHTNSNSSDLEGNNKHLNWPGNAFKSNNTLQNLTFTLHKDIDISSPNLGKTTICSSDDDEEEEEMDEKLMISVLNSNESYNKTPDILKPMESGRESDDDVLTHIDEDSMSSTFCGSDILGKTYSSIIDTSALSEESRRSMSVEYANENTILDESNFVFTDVTKIEELIQEILLEQMGNSTFAPDESSLASDENTSYVTDEESVIRVGSRADIKDAPTEGCADESEVRPLDSSSTEISHLANDISQLTIARADELSEAEESQTSDNDEDPKDAKNSCVLIDLRNVTTKRKYNIRDRFERDSSHTYETPSRVNTPEDVEAEADSEREWPSNESIEQSGVRDKTGLDWNKTVSFANPIFESTRVMDDSTADTGKFTKAFAHSEKMTSYLEESQSWREHSYALKPGKKWLRAVSILKQIRSGSVTGDRFDGTRVKGRKFESFVRDMLEMQGGKYGWSTSLADLSYSNELSTDSGIRTPFSNCVSICNGGVGSVSSLENVTLSSSIFSGSCSDRTVLEKSLINPTIKIIHPEEKPSTFGLDISSLLLEDGCSIKSRSSSGSAKDFVLLQCGQEDVLPFEEYFNERTLKNCVKIGEGVYGEVFKSSDAVIKIIPIEGTDKVNGEPQKKFEEILSEVVIALKLSNLRKGEENRTEGFCEMKRCWCVQGRYPEYLVRLWNEYDQSERGSENDSPIMFKDDQLYIILELANGGKALESFVFTSSAQSLSAFIQTALSLAAAEKAFEFEHRDLHWGNVLISPTKEKFVTIVLDNVEHKIPSKGVKVCIIDFTLSRIYHEGVCIFNDLSVDPSLFQSEGDYQFEIYKMMLREVRNDWSLFRPKTNIFWLHYTLDKMIHMVHYKNKKAKLHKKCEGELRTLESRILDYSDSADFVLSDFLSDALRRL